MFRVMGAVGAALLALTAYGAAAETYVLLEPVRNATGKAMMQAGADGALLPVLKRAADTPVTRQARRVLQDGFAARLPAIDAAARKAAKRKPECPALPEAVFVFLSDEDGGYARQRFYVADAAGKPVLCEDHFIDLTADEASIASGEFEEVLAHEWGHVLLRRVLGPVPPTPSRKFHSARTTTDAVTAFDEGMGIHLQPVSARLARTPGYRARIEGTAETRLADFWFSRQETWVRQALVPQNRLVFAKMAAAADSDGYARWVADETSVNFDTCRLKSGAQMAASEGVVGSFLYKLLAAEPAALEARYGQLVAVLARMAGWPQDEPAITAFVKMWGETFPQEREAVTRLFVATTHGATVSGDVLALQEKTACAGASGNIEAFLEARKEAQAALDGAVADVLAGRLALDAAVGKPVWLAQPEVKTATAPWQGRRTAPVVADLNTARAAELDLLLSGTELAGRADAIVQAREAGPFTGLEDAASRAGLGSAGLDALRRLARAFGQVGLEARK